MVEKFKFWLLSFLLVILFSQTVFALGIGGTDLLPRTEYVEGTTKSYSYNIRNLESENNIVEITKEGELSEWLHISDETLDSETGFSFSVDLVMTSDPLPEPGVISGNVCASELTGNTGGTMFGVLQKTCIKFRADVLFEGQYPEIKLSPVVGTDTANLSVSISNKGTETISSGNLLIQIIDPAEESVIESFDLETTEILSWDSFSETIELDISEYISGVYEYKATFNSDEREYSSTTNFTVGVEDVSLDTYSDSVSLNGIQKLTFNLQNNWALAQTAQFTLVLGTQEVNSESKEIPAWGTEEYNVYLDTSGFDEGEQTGSLLIIFGEDLESEVPVVINFNTRITSVGESYAEGGEGIALWIPITGVIILILVVFVALVYFKNKKEDEDDF